MKKFFPCLILLVFTSGTCSFAQNLDTVEVSNLNFIFKAPPGWPSDLVIDGYCKERDFNIKCDLDTSFGGGYGSLFLRISQVEQDTSSLKSKERSISPLTLAENIFDFTFGTFTTRAYELETLPDSLPPFNSESAKERKTRTKYNRKFPELALHQYITAYRLSVNDSIDIIVAFIGIVPHKYEQLIDVHIRNTADWFFTNNKTAIDSLFTLTNPINTIEPDIRIDSILVLKTYLKYPVMAGWSYDTTTTQSEIKTTILNARCCTPKNCTFSSVTISYRNVEKDKVSKEFQNETEYLDIPAFNSWYEYEINSPDSGKIKFRDSTFHASEQHYYFTEFSDTLTTQECPNHILFSEIVYLYVYTSYNKRIKFTVAYKFSARSKIELHSFRKELIQFFYLFEKTNDFEQFYKHNSER